MSIRLRLLAFVLAVTIPLIAVTVFVMHQLAGSHKDSQREAMLSTTRVLAALADSELETYIGIASALSNSQSLKSGNLSAFYDAASNTLRQWPNTWLVVADASGKQLMHTLRPFGEPLSELQNKETYQLVLQNKRWQVSEVRIGMVSQEPVLDLITPVFVDGEVSYVLILALRPAIFSKLLEKQKLQPGWLSGIIDRNGNFIARNVSNNTLVGQPASVGWRAQVKTADEGTFFNRSLEGAVVVSAFVNSPLTGWSISVAASEKIIDAPLYRSLFIIGAAAAAAFGLSVLLTLWLGRKITLPLAELKQASIAMANQRTVSVHLTGMPEVDEAMKAFRGASQTIFQRETEQIESLARLRLLTNELNHRVKNTLAVIQSMAAVTARGARSVEEFSRTFIARIMSISRTHNVLTESSWETAELRDIISSEMASYQNSEGTRIIMRGADLKLAPKTALDLGMIIHELATNAAKYGSLSVDHGIVHIVWQCEPATSVLIDWMEIDGPPAALPERKGFGSRLIEQIVQTSGRFIPKYESRGFSCRIVMPLGEQQNPIPNLAAE